MREMKFRAKTIKKKRWVYGDLIHQDDIIKNEDEIGDRYCVKPDTVCQYTGLKDKNGVEIYEGDIVKDHYGRIMLVEYAEKFVKFRFKLLYTTGKTWTKNFLYADMYEWFFDEECPEVIGNKWDNPELLKEVEK